MLRIDRWRLLEFSTKKYVLFTTYFMNSFQITWYFQRTPFFSLQWYFNGTKFTFNDFDRIPLYRICTVYYSGLLEYLKFSTSTIIVL